MYQAGFPDLYITHATFGPRWVEIKLPDMIGSSFTRAQNEWFPILVQNGTPIWILTRVTVIEYRKLFEMPQGNYAYYAMLKK